MTISRFVMAVLVAGGLTGLHAEDDDRPERGVARISLVNGEVSVKRGDSGDWTAAAINAPLVVEDRVFTGQGSRAEVQFDYANMIRLASNAEVRLAELGYRRYIVQVARGLVTFRVLRNSEADVEISTPSISIRPIKRGIYRVHVREDGTTEVAVRSGEADIYTPRGTERLKSGRTLLARGTQSDPEFQSVGNLAEDDWDHWNDRRDRDLERSRSYDYVSSDIYGAEDLDHHGRWVYDAPYGWVWSPRVSVGWAPYRLGRWSWIDYYGWSWVSYDPWGWAPYHYGRWYNRAGYGWCWWPGARYSRHYWRPGLVAFFGWGSHSGFNVGIGFGFGRVGWLPLAPHEVYRPWYGRNHYSGYRNRGYIDNSVHVVNNVNITNVYRNARINNAITAVEGTDFAHGRVRNIRAVGANELGRASLVQGQVPVVPQRESMRLADREPVRHERGSGNDRFFSRRQPERVDRATFDEQRQGVERIARRSLGDESVRAVRGEGSRGGDGSGRSDGVRAEVGRSESRSEGARSEVRGDRAGEIRRGAETEGRGWRPAGEDSARAVESGSQRSASEGDRSSGENERGGWRRFGEPNRPSDAGESRRQVQISPRTEGGDQPGRQSRSEDDRGGWRRFGDPTRGIDAGTPGTQRSGGEDRGGWRRLGESSQEVRRSEDSGSRRSIDAPSRSSDEGFSRRQPESGGWRRPEPGSSRGSDSGNSPRRIDSDRVERMNESPRVDSPRRSERSEEPVRISPPIVRERGGGGGRSNEDGGLGRSGRGGGRVYEAPRGGDFGGGRRGVGESPRIQSAPRGGGDFGGGGGRGGGGFSGGGRGGGGDGGGRSSGGVGGGGRSGGDSGGGRSSGGGGRRQ